ncbi:beta-N-acetylhexosaminidase [Chloroflexota bacterium]
MKNLIPKPISVIPAKGSFELNSNTRIFVEPTHEEMLEIGGYLAEKLKSETGLQIPVRQGNSTASEGCVTLKTGQANPDLGEEGYQLAVNPDGVEITAPQLAGIFFGLQTLLQLLPVESGPWEIPCGVIRDYPRFGWRGTMLDVARHFFGVEEVKHYIDLLASYKLNVLHLHLSDDQGWRIEIKSWPNLAEYGGSTAINGDPGGFYTQEQYAEIVAYAQSRYITIVPEIDLPGHTHAALASYPELNCDGVAPALYTGGEVGHSSLCIDKEITYQFVEDVIRELAALTPGRYIHIGGDEARSTPHKDYVYFIERIEPLVQKYGKKMIGWEEVVECSLSPTSVAQYWTDKKHADMAVEKGVKLLISPAQRAYIDMKYTKDTPLGLTWASITNTEKAYDWDPLTEVEGLVESAILGVEAPLWSETLVTMSDVEFMAFPRVIGIAEIGWSKTEGRGWDEYRERLATHGNRLTAKGVTYYRDPGVPWV